MSSTCGLTAIARAMHSRCCWPPDRPEPGRLRRSLTSFHRFAPLRSDFSTTSDASPFEMRLSFSRMPASTLSEMDIVGNGLGRWNTMPTWRRTATGSMSAPYRSIVVQRDRALDVRAGDDLVHAVQGAQERRLAAAGRADERRHRARLDRHRDVVDGQEVAVVDVEVLTSIRFAMGFVFQPRFLGGEAKRVIRRPIRLSSMTKSDQRQRRGPGPVVVDGRDALEVVRGARHEALRVLPVDVHRAASSCAPRTGCS